MASKSAILWAGVPTHPGLASSGVKVSRYLRVHPDEDQDAYFPASPAAIAFESRCLMDINGLREYNVDSYTETLDNQGTATMDALGYILASNATAGDNDDLTIISDRAQVLAADKIHYAMCRVKMTDVDKQGFAFGFVTDADVEIISADPTDGVFLHSAATSAALVGMVVENGNASTDTATLATLADDTFIEVGMVFSTSTTAGDNWGYWYVNGTATPFTAAQLVDLDDMVTTTAPTLCAHIGTRNATSDTTQKVLSIDYAVAYVER